MHFNTSTISWRRSWLGLIGAAVAVLGTIIPAAAQTQAASFQSLGPMPGALYGTYATAVSGDGETVVGYAWVSSQNKQAFRWTRTAGFQRLGDLGGGDSNAYAVSFNGATIVGQSAAADGGLQGFRWTGAEGMTGLPFYEAAAVTANGSLLAGMNF